MNCHRNIILLFHLFTCLPAFAQEIKPATNFRKKTISTGLSFVLIDSNSLVPGSFRMPGVETHFYHLDEAAARLTWKKKPGVDSVSVIYRVMPFRLTDAVSGLNYDSIRFNFLSEPIKINASSAPSRQPLLDLGNIQTEGSIGRAISFGNSQDAVLNSTMNLQLHGFIGDSIELSAAITDNNIPIQPDGNTRDLRDFDRIYIQVKKKGWQAGFGDLDIRFNKNYFLSFYKRLQGGTFSTMNNLAKGRSNFFQVAGALAKGRFNRNILTPLEGNQGPYRLKGANNELYFVVLAGTERVFMDGELLQRGEDRDYVINYNTAEITFTPKRLIQKDRRIQVEFEYADRNYLNSQIFLHDEFVFSPKLKVNLSVYSNSDARNSTIDQPLDNRQKQFLSQIGDSITKAFYYNATPDSYSPGKLLYKKVDTVYNAVLRDSVFTLSTDTSVILYSVSFTYLGPGQGNYMPLLNASNGKAFYWVAPDANQNPTGEWEPVTFLVTPKKQQIISAGLDYREGEKFFIKTEAAISQFDQNLFAEKDKGNDDGYASKTSIGFNLGKASGTKVSAGAGYEFVDENFRPVERLRNVEFLRDWSLPFDAGPAREHIASGFIATESVKGSKFKYEILSYNRSGSYSGLKHIAEQLTDMKGWKITGRFNLLQFSSETQKGNFFRPFGEVTRQFPKLGNTGILARYTGEYNRAKNSNTDSMSSGAFGFEVFDLILSSDQQKLNKWTLTYFRRQDRLPDGKLLGSADKSDNFNFTGELFGNPSHRLRFNAGYRNLTIINERLSRLKPEESLIGRLEYFTDLMKGLVTGNVFYESGSGQELKREFSYVAVQPGQGEFMWVDYNNNGIEELNEFETAIFQDQKKYIRVFTPGSTYVKANYLQFNYSVDINPRSVIKKNKGINALLYNSSASSALQVNQKQLSRGKFLFDPFDANISDTNLISLSTFFSNTYYYNRTDPKWGIEITHSKSAVKSILVYGFESRTIENLTTRVRFKLDKSLIGSLDFKLNGNDLATANPAFANKNYMIRQQSLEPSLTYLRKSNFRVVLSYQYSRKENRLGAMERTTSGDLSADLRYNILSGSSFNGRISFNEIKWEGNGSAINSTSGFILLDGLRPGKNYLWNLDFTRRIGANLEMNVQYEGRKPSGTKTIHIGRASVRALF